MPGYYDGESVSGRVGIRLKDGRKFQHDGIRIELIGMLVRIPVLKDGKTLTGHRVIL